MSFQRWRGCLGAEVCIMSRSLVLERLYFKRKRLNVFSMEDSLTVSSGLTKCSVLFTFASKCQVYSIIL